MGKARGRFLILGCGSIGRRHFRNLVAHGVRSFVLCDTDLERLKVLAREFPDLDIILSIDFSAVVKEHKDISAVVIATPSSLHVPMARRLAEDGDSSGVSLFIEKPLSNTMEGTEELLATVEQRGLVAMMGMCYRFHPVFWRLKELIVERAVGRIYHANYFGGHFLPDWHPDMDYRAEYAARGELGGGVVLTGIHAFDNIRWLFGEAQEVAALTDRVSDLEMDVEDLAIAIFRMKGGHYVSWQGDFLQRERQHRIVIVGELGTIRADFIEGVIEVHHVDKDGWDIERLPFDINTMYLREMAYFLDCHEKGKTPAIDLRDGIRTLRLALSVKESSVKRIFLGQ